MSSQKRKISYWSFEFLSGERHYFDDHIFSRYMTYLRTIDPQELLYRDSDNYKAISLESISSEIKNNVQLYKVVFKSCKYHHSPDYMSSIDGSERPTDKQLTEGEKELTHMCFRIDRNEAYTIFEERRNGVAMGTVVKYLNRNLMRFISETEDIDGNFTLWANIIPPDDFLTALGKTQRISSAELFIEKKILGSGYLQLMEEDSNAQNDLLITVKAKPRKSLLKHSIEGVFQTLTTGGSDINRIRVHGKDINRMSVVIDSLNGKKVDEVTVQLLENGIVDTHSLFSKFEELLEVEA